MSISPLPFWNFTFSNISSSDPKLRLIRRFDAMSVQKSIRKLCFWAPVRKSRATRETSLRFWCTPRTSYGTRNETDNSSCFSFRRNDCILLDCGEGTCSQISRFYGDQSVEIIRKIKAVFISHMHADHYFGLLRLMELRKEVMHDGREPLKVLCPKSDMKSWLFFYDNQVDAIHDDLMFIDNRSLVCGRGGDAH